MKKAVYAVVGLMVLLLLLVIMGVGGAVTGGISGAAGDDSGGGDSGAGNASVANVPPEYKADVEAATKKCSDLRGSLLAAQIWAESNWNPRASSGVANGISQFTPATWSQYGIDGDGDGKADVWNPHDAIVSQGSFMCELYKIIKADMAAHRITRGSLDENVLAAYNAGPGVPEDRRGFPTGIAETDNYAPKILAKEKQYQGAGAGGAGCGSSCPKVEGPFAQRIVAVLQSAVGVPYVYGGGAISGATGGGYDCSGLSLYAMYVATNGQVTLPHSAAMQHRDSRFTVIATGSAHSAALRDAVAKSQPGDLITFNVPEDPAPWGHVGIAIGNGRMIHAPNVGKLVENIPIYDIYDLQVARLSTQK